MTEQQCMNWYYAEQKELRKTLDARAPKELQDEPPSYIELNDRRKDDIRRRVELVLTGEVRRSEMGPGDLAIYFGRYRMLETSPPDSFPKRGEMSRMVVWDCLGFDVKVMPYTYLFDKANIGNLNMTNLQVTGQLACDQTAYLCGWHLSMNKADICTEDLFANATATLTIGDKPQAQRRLIELSREPQPLDCTIPVRQNFKVLVEFFGKSFDRFKQNLIAADRDPERDPFRVWIHLEGWSIREVF